MTATLASASGWVPFMTPMPIWGIWWLLVLPLIVAVAIVYKAVKCESTRRVPIESAKLSVYILAFMGVGAIALALFVEWRL